MRLNPRLFHKLIAIGIVPLLFEIVLAVCLFNNLAAAESQAINERKARQASADLNDLYQKVTGAAQMVGVLVIKENSTPGSTGSTLLENCRQSIVQDLQDIRTLVAADAPMQEQINSLEQTVESSLHVIDEALIDVRASDRMRALSKLRYLRGTVPVITDKLNQLRLHFESAADAHFYGQKQGRQYMRTLLIVALAFNILLIAGVGMVVLIERNITRRLSVLVENTRRLASQQPLLPPVGGTDEIAHLDRVFTDMAGALEKARQEREQIERLKQEFVSMISHDLRTPLTSIQMFLSMLTLGMYGEVSHNIIEKSSKADRNAKRLIGLINDLLDLERMEDGQLQLEIDKADAAALVEESVEAVRGFAEKCGVSLTTNTPDGISIQADSRRLVQVLVNLLSNAIKFSPSGAAVCVSTEENDRLIMFKVSDRGRGVPEAMKAAIFDRFKQVETKDATEKNGTGLGLSICKAIVVGHGGSIGVSNQPNGEPGSVFWFDVPSAAVPVTADSKNEAAV
jgi:signal transduction histidine kinase